MSKKLKKTIENDKVDKYSKKKPKKTTKYLSDTDSEPELEPETDTKTKNSNKIKPNKHNKNLDRKKNDNHILDVKITQTTALKQAFERISNVITDCCIVFIPPDENIDDEDDDYYEEVEEEKSGKNNKKQNKNIDDDTEISHNKNNKHGKEKKNTGGIRILRLTEDKSILIKLSLYASRFDYFRCEEPKITIGVDMTILYGYLKMINDSDPIIIYMKRDNRSILYISSSNEDNESSELKDIEIFLMDIPNPEMPIPQTKFQNIIAMASDKFHSICKHLNNNSSYIEITSVGNEINFRGQSDGGKVTMCYRDINYNKQKNNSDEVVQGLYELKNLMGFSKCNKMCPIIYIYLKNDFPLVLVISVANIGKMYVFLSPIENPNN